MNNRKLLSVSLTILIAVAMLALVAPAVSAQDQGSMSLADGELQQQDVQQDQVTADDTDVINVSVEPADVEVEPGAAETYSVFITNATDGIEAYDFNITIVDDSVADFTDITENKGGSLSNSTVTDNGDRALLEVALGNDVYEASNIGVGDKVEIATIDIEADGGLGDETPVEVDSNPEVQEEDNGGNDDQNGTIYSVDSVSNSTFSINLDWSLNFDTQDLQAGDRVEVDNLDYDGGDATVVVTYENGGASANNGGSTVIAGLKESVSGTSTTITLQDRGGLNPDPQSDNEVGDHTAHIIPTGELSGNYEPGDVISPETASVIADSDQATITDLAIPDLTGLDITIRDGLTIGDDYPLNQRTMFATGSSIYGNSGLGLPLDAEEEDERFLPIANGQHVGLGGLPIQDEVYQWLNVSGSGYPSETLLNYQSDDPSQTVAVSFAADDTSPVTLDYSEAAAHGLELTSFSVDETDNINRNDFTLNSSGLHELAIEFDENDIGSDSPTVQFNLVWEAENPVEGLSVDEANAIDYETDHRVIAADSDQVRDNFVTFEAGATGISHNDTTNGNNGFIGEPADGTELESFIDTDGAADGTSNDGSFLVWQNQRVTFETQNLDDTIDIYETDIDSDGNYTLGPQVDEAQVGFDDTAPGQVANLNTSNLDADEQYFVTFGQNKQDAIVLDVRPLNLGASSPDSVPETENDEPLEIDVTSDDTTGGNVEAWIAKEPLGANNETSEVIHVERDVLTGEGDRTMEVVPSVDLTGPGTYTATILHTESGVTTTTQFTIGVVADPPTPVEFADNINIVSPSLDAPDEPGRFDRGDIIPVELELEGGNAGTITFGNAEEENVEVHATVYDTGYTQTDVRNNADTTVTVYLSTYHIGHGHINQNTTTDPSGYQNSHLNLTLNQPDTYTPAAANDRDHGFFTEPSSDSALVPDGRLARSDNVFAHGAMDIYGGSQSGAVLSSQVSYDFHATSDSSELPYTLIGDDREEDRDDINFLDVGSRSTGEFQYWRAPGEGANALDQRLPNNITTEDIASLVEEGVITPLETENGSFVEPIAENDFVIVQNQATGTEGVMLEAVLRDYDNDGVIGAELQEYIDTIQDESVDDEITAEFNAADGTSLDRFVPHEPPYANRSPFSTMLDYQFSLTESQASQERRADLAGPNIAASDIAQIDADTTRFATIADLNFDQSQSTFYVPYQVTEDLPAEAGDAQVDQLGFNFQNVFDVRGGTQANPALFDDEDRIRLEDNAPLNDGADGILNVTNLEYVVASLNFDAVHLDGGTLQVPGIEDYTISGTTTMAPGTLLNARLLSELDEATPFLKTEEEILVVEQDDGPLSAFEVSFDFDETRDDVEIQGGTPFEADFIRTGTGTVPGGDDVPGLVLEDSSVATFEFNEQRSDGNAVSVAAFESNRAAQITIMDGDGNELGTSDVLPRNELQEEFNVVLDEQIDSNQEVTAVAEIVQPDPTQLNDTVLAEETASILVEDLAEPFFSVSDLSPQTAAVEQGAQVTVEATVENMGEQEGTQSIDLDIDGISFSETVTLGGGESTTVSFTADTSGVDPGDYTHTVSSDDDSVVGALTVESQPTPGVFEIISLSPSDATVTQGDEVVVDVSLQNVGETEATEDVVLEVSGLGEVGSQSVTLGAGEADSVTFTVGTGEVDAGDYTHTVSTAEDSAEGSLTIEEQMPADDSTDNGSDDGDGGDGSGPGFGIAAAALALLGAALLAMRRRAE